MLNKSRLAVLTVLLTALFSVTSSAARPEKGISFGTVNSFRGIGFCTDIGTEDFHAVSIISDLTEILNGRSSMPGLRLTYHYDMTVCSGETKSGYPYIIYAGPGIAQGYVKTLDNRRGYMAGLSGAAGGKVLLARNISVSAEFQADAALIFKNRHTQYMSFYETGLRHCYIPYIRIQYRF